MENIGTTFFYVFLLFMVYFLCRSGEKQKEKGFIIAAYGILFIVSAIRFDIGNDYRNYYEFFNSLLNKVRMPDVSFMNIYKWTGEGDLSLAVFPWIIGKMFSVNGCSFVFGLFSATTMFFLYKTFDKYNCHALGLYIYIITELLFFSWDWTRQCAALSLLLLSYTFAQEKKILKFLLCVLGAAFFHRSALLVIPFYIFTYLKIHKLISVLIIIAAVAAFWLGLFRDVVEQSSLVFSFMENDYARYGTSEAATLSQFESFNWKLRVTAYAIFWASTVIIIDKKYYFYSTLLTIGTVLFILANGSLVFSRIAMYFYAVDVLAVPLSFKGNLNKLKRNVLIALIIWMGMFYVYDCVTGTYTRGSVPYRTIFSEDARMLHWH